MDSNRFETRMRLLLSTLRALLEEILPNLRAVSIGFNNDEVKLYCFFHGDYSDDD